MLLRPFANRVRYMNTMIALGLAQREPLDNRSQIVRPPLRRRKGELP